jgi:hypothetical protein
MSGASSVASWDRPVVDSLRLPLMNLDDTGISVSHRK